MAKYKIGYFDDIVEIDDYIERDGEYVSNSEIVDILNELSDENKQLKLNLKEETDRVIKLEQYIYTKLCPKSEHYDEEALSEIINGILGD